MILYFHSHINNCTQCTDTASWASEKTIDPGSPLKVQLDKNGDHWLTTEPRQNRKMTKKDDCV